MVDEIVRRGVAANDAGSVYPRLMMLAIFGMCSWAHRWFGLDGPLTARKLAERLFDVLVRGPAAPGGSLARVQSL